MTEETAGQIALIEKVGVAGGARSTDPGASLLGRMVAMGKDTERRENLWDRSARFALKSAPSQPRA